MCTLNGLFTKSSYHPMALMSFDRQYWFALGAELVEALPCGETGLLSGDQQEGGDPLPEGIGLICQKGADAYSGMLELKPTSLPPNHRRLSLTKKSSVSLPSRVPPILLYTSFTNSSQSFHVPVPVGDIFSVVEEVYKSRDLREKRYLC